MYTDSLNAYDFIQLDSNRISTNIVTMENLDNSKSYFVTDNEILIIADEWKHETDCTVSQCGTINLVHS